jgi:hypothetical protein
VSSLLIVTGPPGAGKSTVAGVLTQRFEPSVLVEGDSFFGFIQRGAMAPISQRLPQRPCHFVLRGRFFEPNAAGGFTTIFDGMVGPWFLSTFLQATGLAGVEYAVLLPSVELCVHRVQSRRTMDSQTRPLPGTCIRPSWMRGWIDEMSSWIRLRTQLR